MKVTIPGSSSSAIVLLLLCITFVLIILTTIETEGASVGEREPKHFGPWKKKNHDDDDDSEEVSKSQTEVDKIT
jgi:hypothetical protein